MSKGSALSRSKAHIGSGSFVWALVQLENSVSSLHPGLFQADPPHLLVLQGAAVQAPGVPAYGVDSPAVLWCCSLGVPHC